jgi:hypothetical protein
VVTNMIYIGSTSSGHDRFYQHLVTGTGSNHGLQEAINIYGLSKFIAYVFVEVTYPKGINPVDQTIYLREIEQMYMAKFNKAQLYNTIKAAAS